MKMSYSFGKSAEKEQNATNQRYPEYCRTMLVKDSNGQTKELVFPKALDLDRPKRARTQFSADQLAHLEREFARNPYLVGKERTQLASRLQLSETQVKVWFQNRRTKRKRDKQKDEEISSIKAESMATKNLMNFLKPAPNIASKSTEPATDNALMHGVGHKIDVHSSMNFSPLFHPSIFEPSNNPTKQRDIGASTRYSVFEQKNVKFTTSGRDQLDMTEKNIIQSQHRFYNQQHRTDAFAVSQAFSPENCIPRSNESSGAMISRPTVTPMHVPALHPGTGYFNHQY